MPEGQPHLFIFVSPCIRGYQFTVTVVAIAFVHCNLSTCSCRQIGQDTAEELRSKDFRKDLEERERQAARERVKEKGSRSSTEQPKRPRLDQPPPSNLDADDPVEDDEDDDSEERYSTFYYFDNAVWYHL